MEAFFIMTQNPTRRNLPTSAQSRALTAKRADSYDRPLILTALKSGLFGVGATFCTGLVLITTATAIAYANPDPSFLSPILALAALMISSFVGGFVSTKISKESPLLCGAVTGSMTALISLALSLMLFFLPTSNLVFWQSLLLHGIALGFSVLGAFAGNIKLTSRRGKRRFGK
jgi:putative membrane protein (TIGR04086 family)